MSCEHFFCTWGCQKEATANPQDHLGRESIPDDASMTGPKAPEHKLVASKKIEKLPRICKIGARGPGQQIYQGLCESMTVLDC